MIEKNLSLPGNPRYQPEALIPYFGYDNLVKFYVVVEIVLLHALHEIGVIPDSVFAKLTPEVKKRLMTEITTSGVDRIEREVTKHDIRALVMAIKKRIDPELHRYVHLGATSYDIIETGRILSYKMAFWGATYPVLSELIRALMEKVDEYKELTQIGRTHGQHAIPITVGFWLATILNRVVFNFNNLAMSANYLTTKFSGAVGACNASHLFGFDKKFDFEERVLLSIDLKRDCISTQILSPEPVARFFHNFVLLSASLAQLGRDGRHLQRSEIGEIMEEFKDGQTGSSTMAHKDRKSVV